MISDNAKKIAGAFILWVARLCRAWQCVGKKRSVIYGCFWLFFAAYQIRARGALRFSGYHWLVFFGWLASYFSFGRGPGLMGGDAFKLPSGQVHIAFSGGRTSAYMLHQIAEANGGIPDSCRVVFANTGREMGGTLDFVQEVSQRWLVPITWVQYTSEKPWFEVVSHNSAARDGEPFEAMIKHKRYVPNGRKRICTEQLKVRAAKRMLVASGWKRWTKALGIRADEHDRLEMPDQPREKIWLPLAAAGVTRGQVLRFWKAQPFDLPESTVSNCRLCFQFQRAKLANQMLKSPSDLWPERMEATGFGTFLDGRPWADFRKAVEDQGDMFIDWTPPEGRSCGASNDGECVG